MEEDRFHIVRCSQFAFAKVSSRFHESIKHAILPMHYLCSLVACTLCTLQHLFQIIFYISMLSCWAVNLWSEIE